METILNRAYQTRRFNEYSIDDLHQTACAELGEDEIATEILNALYSDLRAAYVSVYFRLRGLADRQAA